MNSMKKETRLVITEDEVYWTVDGQRLTPKQAELLQKRLDNEELDKILGEKPIKNKKEEKTNDALWAIADDMRYRKDEGEFDTYRLAYSWAVKNYRKRNSTISVSNLERAWHKAKSEGKVGIKKERKVSVPFMITQKMRMRLRSLKYSNDDIKKLTPKEANDIIRELRINSNPSGNHGRNQ